MAKTESEATKIENARSRLVVEGSWVVDAVNNQARSAGPVMSA